MKAGNGFRWKPVEDGYLVPAFHSSAIFRQCTPTTVEILCEAGLEEKWIRYLDPGTDYLSLQSRIPREDAFLTRAAGEGQGLRILRQEPWEMLVTFIISQRKNIQAIRTTVERICCRAGDRLEDGVYAFPTPRQIPGGRCRSAGCGRGRLPDEVYPGDGRADGASGICGRQAGSDLAMRT